MGTVNRPQFSELMLVALGGVLGGPARYAIGLVWPTTHDGIPWATFVINVVGAFGLGLLLESLARAGADTGIRRQLRLLLGTGFLGTFTTYSALAVDTDLLVHDGALGAAAAYAVGSVVAGIAAGAAGVAVGVRFSPLRTPARPDNGEQPS